MKLDKRQIMRRAHADFKWWRDRGAPRTWSDCLKGAWAAARMAKAIGSTKFQTVRAA